MAHTRGNHLTLEDLATRFGLSTDEAWGICLSESVPVVHGRIDRSLFALVYRDVEARDASRTPVAA